MTVWRPSCLLPAGAVLCLLAGGVCAQVFCQEQQKLIAPDGHWDYYFGRSVSASGTAVIIGRPENHISTPGSAHVFRHDGVQWTLEEILQASDGAGLDYFGGAVSIDGNVAIAGVVGDDDDGVNSGSAYVFRHDGARWTQEQKLVASDAAERDGFGRSVSACGDTAIVGAGQDDDNGEDSGSAYVFCFDGTVWTEEQKLVAPDGAADDGFGYGVAVNGQVVIVGAGGDDDNGEVSGSAYVFRHDGVTWTLEQKLLPADGAAGAGFGGAVAVNGDIAIVGASGDDEKGKNSGAAYVFRYRDGTWNQEQKLLATNGSDQDKFGVSVAIDDAVAVVGARYHDSRGSVYLYEHNGRWWPQRHQYFASDGSFGDAFGISVAIDGHVVVVGATGDDDYGNQSGSAYICSAHPKRCPGDTNCDRDIDVDDLNNVIIDWGTSGVAHGGDVTGAAPGSPRDGAVDVNDLVTVINHWGLCEPGDDGP